MIGLYDCSIVCFTAKYHFLDIRPKIYDPSITYIIDVPKHPSYPAGHAIEGTVASLILSHFFEEKSAHWKQMATESGLSRIWAGIHYPIDIEAGIESGTKVANKVLESTK